MARQPRGFALSFRFEPPPLRPSARRALAVSAYLSIGFMMLALAAVPEARAMAADVSRIAAVEEPATVFHPIRPLVTVVRADPPRVITQTVAPDDTIFTVADRYHVTPQTVAYNNGLTDTNALRAGSVLAIPTVDAAVYKVRRGDSVTSVAEQFGVDVTAIADANRLLYEPDNFSVGATIIVPVADGRFPGFLLHVTAAARPAPFARSLTRVRLLLPVRGGVVTQGFSSFHTAVDVAGPYGAPVLASEAGTVAAVGYVNTGGLRVCVRHDWGLQTCYYHLSTTRVSEGERVGRGQTIGNVGLTGVTTGPHVHWEASIEGAFVDPQSY
ncbi:MAG: hypothetical protein AUH85_02935 [Chloroflexi bacterium 13_1_40CM_4_68_4]|nr:MAG: hypothetical protein AUH85_02935 [Chloroflexi bacterium 13_1_40CM_4_68_4]